MSQIEQDFRNLLSKKPEIEKCYSEGLINRRSLARYLIKKNIAKSSQLDAAIAMLRRFDFSKSKKEPLDKFRNIRINIKDQILILDFEKNKSLLQKLQKLIAHTNYDKGDTLKIVIGSSSIKVFIDAEKEDELKELFKEYKLQHRLDKISEISLIFSDKAIDAKGILSAITREFFINDIVISELLTTSPELIIYLNERYVLMAYNIIKGLQE